MAKDKAITELEKKVDKIEKWAEKFRKAVQTHVDDQIELKKWAKEFHKSMTKILEDDDKWETKQNKWFDEQDDKIAKLERKHKDEMKQLAEWVTKNFSKK